VRGEELRIERGDGTWGDTRSTPRPCATARGALVAGVALFEDLTERRRLEAACEREGYRERFLGILGHDLRGPLATIALAAQQLGRERAASSRARALQGADLSSCRRMERMINDLLDFARARQGAGIPGRAGPPTCWSCPVRSWRSPGRRAGGEVRLEASGDLGGEWARAPGAGDLDLLGTRSSTARAPR
jgi:signal transduction histidine kinase